MVVSIVRPPNGCSSSTGNIFYSGLHMPCVLFWTILLELCIKIWQFWKSFKQHLLLALFDFLNIHFWLYIASTKNKKRLNLTLECRDTKLWPKLWPISECIPMFLIELEPCIQIRQNFLNFSQILAIENLKKIETWF
jgi:hypothetical protein